MLSEIENLLLQHDKSDEDIEKQLPWFYENVKCFHQVKEEAVKQIIRRSKYVHMKKDHVIIQQGQSGDCCYIILQGAVSIYARRMEDSDYHDEPSSAVLYVRTHKERAKFGVEVSVLRSGDKFGDLCFYKANGERNATAIAENDLYLLVVRKHIYERYLTEKFLDMKDQLSFMETSTLFKDFPYDYRVTLLEKFKAKRYNYGTTIVHQGERAKSLFVVCRGEALLKVNPAKLSQQYRLPVDDNANDNDGPLTVIQKRRKILKGGYQAGEALIKRKNVTISTVGSHQIIGDVEFVLNLETHHVTAACHSAMLVMEVDYAELHKVMLRRDSNVAYILKANVMSKVGARANRCADAIPQYRQLYDMATKMSDRKEASGAAKVRRATIADVANIVKLSSVLGAGKMATKAKTREQRASIATNAFKKNIAGAGETAGGLKATAGKPEGIPEGTPQEDGATIRKAKGKPRKDVQQDKEKKQFTVKEYRALKKKMQAAGKTITPLD